MTARKPAVRGEDPQKPGEPTARRHPSGPEQPAPQPAVSRNDDPDDDGRARGSDVNVPIPPGR